MGIIDYHRAHDPKEEIPSEVLQFVLNLICSERNPSYQEESLATSTSQDICRAVTSDQQKMKKHILLCMTLCHCFRSERVTTLINKLGQYGSYTYSFELETALANSNVESASLISNSDIIKRQPDVAVFHSDRGNFDQLISDVYGTGSIHTTVGIYQQDLGSCADAAALTSVQHTWESNPNTQSTKKKRSFKSPIQELPSYFKQKRSEPANLASSSSNNSSTYSNSKSSYTDLIWVIACKINSRDQHIPVLSGWVSVTG